jgi:small subunit ribosomal protein S17
MTERKRRKTFVGIVESNKMQRTITVRVQRLIKHPTYGKYIEQSTKLKADDPKNECGIGDKVKVMSTRPLSKTKRWRLVEILEKAR